MTTFKIFIKKNAFLILSISVLIVLIAIYVTNKQQMNPYGDISVEEQKGTVFENFQSGNVDDSLLIVDQILEENPNDIDAILTKAQILANKGSMNFNEEEYAGQSIELIDRVLAIDPQNTTALYAKGYALEIQNRFDEALEYYSSALELDNQNIFVLNQIGHTYDLMGDKELAFEYYQKAIEINPNFDKAQLNVSRHYLMDDDMEKAEEAIRIVIDNSSDFRSLSEAYNGLGHIYESIDLNDALEYMEKSLEYQPEYPNSLIGVGWIKFRLNFDEMMKNQTNINTAGENVFVEPFELVNKAIEIHPEQTLGYLTLARMNSFFPYSIEEALDNYEKAIEVVDSDITVLGSDREVFKNDIKAEYEQYKESANSLNIEVSVEPKSMSESILSFVLQPEVAFARDCDIGPGAETDYCYDWASYNSWVAHLNNAGHTISSNSGGSAYCVNGSWIECVNCDPPPPPPPPSPVNGICGSADNEYYANPPSGGVLCDKGSRGTVDWDDTEEVHYWICGGRHGGDPSPTCKTARPQCDNFDLEGNPIDDDNDGLYNLDDPDCNGNPDKDTERGPGGATVSCSFSPDKLEYEIDDTIVAAATVSGSGYDLDDINFLWSGNMGNVNQPSITKTLSDFGVYQASVSIDLGKDGNYEFENVMCQADLTGDDITVSNAPEITFSIDKRLAEDDNKCEAKWSVGEGATSTCEIITEFDETAEDLHSITGPDPVIEGEYNYTRLNAGNEYRLQCQTQDDLAEIITSPSYRCVDPDLLEV